MTYYIRCKDSQRWKVREAVSLRAALGCIVMAQATVSVGGTDILDETYCGGTKRVMASVVRLNSDNTEQQAYQEAY